MSNICSKTPKDELEDRSYSYRYNPTLKTPKIVTAANDYASQSDGEINILKGDRLQVIDDTMTGSWRVIHLATREIGLVPVYMIRDEDEEEIEFTKISSLSEND